MKLISDKTKITDFKENILFQVQTADGYCNDFNEHREKIIDRIETLIKEAIDDEDDVKLLASTYLDLTLWGDTYTMANSIAESQQMAAALTPLKESYHKEGKSKLTVKREIPAENKFSEKEEKENHRLYDEITLIRYLETLQNKFLENC